MKLVTQKEFYAVLWAETRDIIISTSYPESKGNGEVGKNPPFYPYIQEFAPRNNTRSLFGKARSLGYVNGIYTTEYYLAQ